MSHELIIRRCDIADARGARRGVDVSIRDGVIVGIDRSRISSVRPGEIDGAGMTVVPGLINMHEHFGIVHPGTHEESRFAGESDEECLHRMVENAELALRAGVTSVRLVGERDGLDGRLRTLIEAGDVRAPRVWSAGQPLDFAGGGRAFIGAIECSCAEEFDEAAHAQIAVGADLIKVMLSGSVLADSPVYTGLSVDEFDAVRQVARGSVARIAIHCVAEAHPIMDRVLDDGVDSLEHCYLMSEDLLERCVEREILLVLTPLVTRSPEYFLQIGLSKDVVEQMQETGERHWQAVRSAVRLNARIALGTDIHSHTCMDGVSAVVRELELYEEAGASPLALLDIASRSGACWLGVDSHLGLVEEGFCADLLMLAENPLEVGASGFRAARSVISRGVLID